MPTGWHASCLLSILWSDKRRCGWKEGVNHLTKHSFICKTHVAVSAGHLGLSGNNGVPPFLGVPLNHLLWAIWPSHIIEVQAVVLGCVADTCANPKDGSGPAACGYLQCSKLTLWWTNQKRSRASSSGTIASPGSEWKLCLTGTCESHSHLSKVVPNWGIKHKSVSV